jgi:hypothetical protein
MTNLVDSDECVTPENALEAVMYNEKLKTHNAKIEKFCKILDSDGYPFKEIASFVAEKFHVNENWAGYFVQDLRTQRKIS